MLSLGAVDADDAEVAVEADGRDDRAAGGAGTYGRDVDGGSGGRGAEGGRGGGGLEGATGA
jgi:hypothetical protein